jgi:CRP-like cAMP-binding protein
MAKCEHSQLALRVSDSRKMKSSSRRAIPVRAYISSHLVSAGKVRIFNLSPSGREQILAVEGPGSSFAELPVFDGGNYPAAASALEDTEVLFISRKDFQNFCREHPDVGLKVIAVVGSRLRRLVGIIEELSFTTVRQRLIALILRLAQASSTRSKEGIHVELTKSHQDLAAELGTVRELVSRNLGRLQAEGFLDVEGSSPACTRNGLSLAGYTSPVVPAVIFSGLLFVACAALNFFVGGVDRSSRQR